MQGWSGLLAYRGTLQAWGTLLPLRTCFSLLMAVASLRGSCSQKLVQLCSNVVVGRLQSPRWHVEYERSGERVGCSRAPSVFGLQ